MAYWRFKEHLRLGGRLDFAYPYAIVVWREALGVIGEGLRFKAAENGGKVKQSWSGFGRKKWSLSGGRYRKRRQESGRAGMDWVSPEPCGGE